MIEKGNCKNVNKMINNDFQSKLVIVEHYKDMEELFDIIASSGYIPERSEVLCTGYFIFYYSTAYIATMAAWFFELKNIAVATVAGWSLLKVKGYNSSDLLKSIFPEKLGDVSFFVCNRDHIWIAVHGIYAKESVIYRIRHKRWKIIEIMYDRSFFDVVQLLNLCEQDYKLVDNDIVSERLLVKLFGMRKATILNCKECNIDGFELHISTHNNFQQRLLLLSRCCRMVLNRDDNNIGKKNLQYTRIIDNNKSKLLKYNIFFMLAVRNNLYQMPVFLKSWLPNNTLKTLKLESFKNSDEDKLPYKEIYENNLINEETIKFEYLRNKFNKGNNFYLENDICLKNSDTIKQTLRVIFRELIQQYILSKSGYCFPSVDELRELWLKRFTLKNVDIMYLIKLADLTDFIIIDDDYFKRGNNNELKKNYCKSMIELNKNVDELYSQHKIMDNFNISHGEYNDDILIER
ncbi:hypothetical protein ACR3K2_37160 [Cryptosporidium serpentis]